MKGKHARHPQAGGTQRARWVRGTGSTDLQRGVCTWCYWLPCLPWGCEGASGGHGTTSTHRPCFFPVSRLLVKLMWLLLNCISLGQKRNTKPPHVKMKVLWQCLPLSLSENRKQSSLLPACYTYFPPYPPTFFFFYFRSWQPDKNSIHMLQGCGASWMGHFLSSWPPSLVLSLPRVISHLVKSELCQPLGSGACGSPPEFCCLSMKNSSFYYCL